MKRPMILLISTAFILTSLAGCMAGPKVTEDTSEAVTVVTSETTAAPTTTTETTTEATTTTEDPRGHFEFKPHVMSKILGDYMGEDICIAYDNYIDAVMSGEDDFEVKDSETYDWMIGQMPCFLFPVVCEYTGSFYDGAVNNGRGKFLYKISKDEFKVKEAEFEKLVTDILNENLRDNYSDFEKVLALYIYFSDTYTYDYDAYHNPDIDSDTLGAYRFLTTGHGICSECAPAFSYLLLQAGVESTVVGGHCPSTDDGHSWVYVTINGKNYHVDPTYVMSSSGYLSYLMMTDEQREVEDGYQRKDFRFARNPSGEYEGKDLVADDDYFAPLWGGYFTSWDTDKNIIYYIDVNGNDATFDYSSFEN